RDELGASVPMRSATTSGDGRPVLSVGRTGPWVVGADHEGQRQTFLVLVLSFLVRIAGVAHRLAAVEEDLRYPLAGVDLGGQRRRVADLDGNAAAPLRFQRRHIHYDAATRIRTLAHANRDDVARDLQVLDGLRQGEAVRRNETVIALHVHERRGVEVLR